MSCLIYSDTNSHKYYLCLLFYSRSVDTYQDTLKLVPCVSAITAISNFAFPNSSHKLTTESPKHKKASTGIVFSRWFACLKRVNSITTLYYVQDMALLIAFEVVYTLDRVYHWLQSSVTIFKGMITIPSFSSKNLLRIAKALHGEVTTSKHR